MPGNLLAILCAMVWSLAVILMKKSGARIHPLALNLGKNIFGLVLLLASCFIVDGHLHIADAKTMGLLLLSGFLGIGVADGLILRAMQHLHASHVAILECLFAPYVIGLSMLFLNEHPSPMMLLGGAMILASLLCISPNDAKQDNEPAQKLGLGIGLMCIGLFLVALGIIMIKPLFQSMPLLSLVTIRMIAGVAGSGVIFLFIGERRARFREFWQTPHKLSLFWGCFFSSYLSLILWIAGYKYLQATTAALLNQTSTAFTVLFAMIFLKERLNKRKLIAIFLAMSGVAVITLAS